MTYDIRLLLFLRAPNCVNVMKFLKKSAFTEKGTVLMVTKEKPEKTTLQ